MNNIVRGDYLQNKFYILCVLAALIIQYVEIYAYPRIAKRRMRDIGKYKPTSFCEEYRVGIHGYLCYGSRLMVILFVLTLKPDEPLDGEFYFLWGLLLAVALYYIFKLVYILPRRYFRYENGVIYYRGLFKEHCVGEIKVIYLSRERKCSYFKFYIRNEENPKKFIYIDVLAFKNPENIYGILKRESYDFLK